VSECLDVVHRSADNEHEELRKEKTSRDVVAKVRNVVNKTEHDRTYVPGKKQRNTLMQCNA
jgi:hypothetical protein